MAELCLLKVWCKECMKLVYRIGNHVASIKMGKQTLQVKSSWNPTSYWLSLTGAPRGICLSMISYPFKAPHTIEQALPLCGPLSPWVIPTESRNKAPHVWPHLVLLSPPPHKFSGATPPYYCFSHEPDTFLSPAASIPPCGKLLPSSLGNCPRLLQGSSSITSTRLRTLPRRAIRPPHFSVRLDLHQGQFPSTRSLGPIHHGYTDQIHTYANTCMNDP